jgi:hypothetical protein
MARQDGRSPPDVSFPSPTSKRPSGRCMWPLSAVGERNAFREQFRFITATAIRSCGAPRRGPIEFANRRKRNPSPLRVASVPMARGVLQPRYEQIEFT